MAVWGADSMTKILIAGALDFSKEESRTFVRFLGEEVIAQGHVLLNGCRNEFDRIVAEGAQTHHAALRRSRRAHDLLGEPEAAQGAPAPQDREGCDPTGARRRLTVTLALPAGGDW